MTEFYLITRNSGARLLVPIIDEWNFPCPVCGFIWDTFGDGMLCPPYLTENGLPNYEICSCDFQFGYDDSPSASGCADKPIMELWLDWRINWLRRCFEGNQLNQQTKRAYSPKEALEQLENININVRLPSEARNTDELLQALIPQLKQQQELWWNYVKEA